MKNLLIIDTSTETLHNLTNIINWNEMGIKVLGACQNSIDACDILANNSISIVLIDINIIALEYLNLICYISNRYPCIKIIGMGTSRDSQSISKTIHALLNGFIFKPIVLDKLVNTFSNLSGELSYDEASYKVQPSIPTNQISAQAKEYINCNISVKGLSLKTTAEALHIGYHYLSKRFTEQEGISFTEYLTEKRLDIACRLLTTTSLHNYEICEQIGLEPKNFHRLFLNKYKISPQKYRALHTTK